MISESSTQLKDEEKVKFLWDVIKRIDFYINSLNTKGALLMTFNAAVLGFAITRWDAAINLFRSLSCAASFGVSLFYIAIFATAISIFLTLLVVFPFLESGKSSGKSILFFMDIASLDDYEKRFSDFDQKALVSELSDQIAVISKGAKRKFLIMVWAIRGLLFIQIPLFAIDAFLILAKW